MANINKIAKPKIAVIDADSPLFQAASAAEKVCYTYTDKDGHVVAEFSSAKEGKNWLEEVETFGMDIRFGYEGDVSELERSTSHKVGSEKKAFKAFDHIIEDWVKQSGCSQWKAKVAKASGLPVFRHEIATLNEYKGGRNSRKPHHLNSVRKYAIQSYEQVSAVRGAIEVDDIVVAMAEKWGHKACLVAIDKDSRQVRGTWLYMPDDMDEPQYSDPDIVGWLEKTGKGKLVGMGHLFLLSQMCTGDTADSIIGLPKSGPAKAYDILSPFTNMPYEKGIKNAVEAVGEAYREKYGLSHQYEHWQSGELLTSSWKDIFKENLRLLWMKRHKDDEAEDIFKYVEGM